MYLLCCDSEAFKVQDQYRRKALLLEPFSVRSLFVTLLAFDL